MFPMIEYFYKKNMWFNRYWFMSWFSFTKVSNDYFVFLKIYISKTYLVNLGITLELESHALKTIYAIKDLTVKFIWK